MNQVVLINHLAKRYEALPLFEDLNFSLEKGDRLALVAPNGAGKTTLARIIAGEESADSGNVTHFGEIGYLPQELPEGVDPSTSIDNFLRGALETLSAEMRALEEQMAAGEEVIEQYGELQEKFEHKGGYASEHLYEQVLEGLDLTAIDRSRPIGSLSGGERTRLFLASLLLGTPDLLILDEPTNHLDERAMLWLEEYLASYPGALLLISHDRTFLDRTANRIGALEEGQLHIYHGNYAFYLAERERLFEKACAEYDRWRGEIRELRQTIKQATFATAKPRRNPSDPDKLTLNRHGELSEKSQGSKLRAAKRRLEELEGEGRSKPQKRWEVGYRLNPVELTSQQVVRFGSKEVLKGERIVLFGSNGCGKTTLLDRIAHGGEGVMLAPSARIGYLDQMQRQLDGEHTVLDAYRSATSGSDSDLRAELRKYGLFGGEEVFKKVKHLSSGQRQKLQLAKMIASKANVWLLDEPTNHLDLETIERLERALCEEPVTVLAVTHDRRFAEKVATAKWTMNEKGEIA